MISCDYAKQQFSAYLDNGLSTTEQAELEVHLSNCESCSTAYAQIVYLNQRMQNLTAVNTSPHFDQVLRTRIMQNKSAHRGNRAILKNLYFGIAGVTTLAAVTFFTLTTINAPSASNPGISVHSIQTVSSSDMSLHKVDTQPSLVSDTQKEDTLKIPAKTVDQSKIHLVGQDQE